MCGICGKLNFNNQPVEESLLRKMTASLVHRGPDDEGIYIKGNVGLGHRRLSILDLSSAGHQPMSNEDGTLWIVFNGEIYNFQELKEDLQEKGHIFCSHTDTEVIIHLYEEEGEHCVKKLRGMFAFAIWNAGNQTLFLARDRVGKKPLYYRHTQDSFLFGSEIKAILADSSFKRTPDLTAIHHYLTYQYVPAPWTAFEGIKKLPPAHYLILKDGRAELKRYWKLSYLPKHTPLSPHFSKGGRGGFERELRNELLRKLTEAVRIRLVSDVPLGAFLSGGIDSSAVVACMAALSDRPVKTFSIGFREEKYNELRYARIVAELFKTEHTEFIVEPHAAEVIDKLVWHYNEPFADSSAIPTYYVSKLAKEHVTVVLNGDGGDESFAGYGRYAAEAFARKIELFFPDAAAKMALKALLHLPHGKDPMNTIWRAKRFLQEYLHAPELRNANWMSHFSSGMKPQFYTDEFLSTVGGTDSFDILYQKYDEAETEDFLDKILYADVMMYLPDDLLVKVDVASMANALEARSPFLDHELMEFAAQIPASLKLKGRTTKHILKEALRGILPEEILFREKMGFAVPLDHWFRGELKEMAYDILLSSRALARGYFRRDAIKKILDEHVSGTWNWQNHIWNLLMLELWHRMFIDEKTA